MTVDATPERNLIAAVLERALLDLRGRKTRAAAHWWIANEHGTCPSYCNALGIPYCRFRTFAGKLAARFMNRKTR